LLPASAAANVVEGDYVEARTCDVYTGPCFANAEVNEAGKEATFGWRIRSGEVDGVRLDGLSVVALVRASATLGDPYSDPAPSRSVMLVDERADANEREALERFARDRLGALAGTVAEVRRAPIELEVGCCAKAGCARLEAGDVVSLETRCVGGDDHVCGNEEVYYPPLTDGVDAVPAVLTDHEVVAASLGVRFQEAGTRGAFTGTFRAAVAAAAAPPAVAIAPNARADAEARPASKFALKEIPRVEGEEAPSLPEEIPAAFAGLLDPRGMRVEMRGKALYDVWFRAGLPVAETPHAEMSSSFGAIPLGAFVGVVRSYGLEVDYRESPIDPGFYALRYGLQPTDGDHLGTAPSRDFLVLTGFEDDRETAPVSDMEELSELSLLASSTEHPTVWYLLVPEGEPSERARLYEHGERDEWILDVTLPKATGTSDGGGEGGAEAAPGETKDAARALRLGVVLVGVSEHY
ncbi:MAG: DUF1326 domain-containing protein, partial [Planctomycetota bacterium JB042]